MYMYMLSVVFFSKYLVMFTHVCSAADRVYVVNESMDVCMGLTPVELLLLFSSVGVTMAWHVFLPS